MLIIRKDGTIKKVTQGCYENLYKKMGYEIVSGNTDRRVVEETPATPSPVEPINEKPTTENNTNNVNESLDKKDIKGRK